jgi:putative phage-type endonuclease
MAAVVQGSQEWLKQRLGKISGTAVGVLERVNPYRKTEELVRDMVRDLAGAPSEFKMVPAVEHGQMMEDVAKCWYERTFDLVVDETDFVTHPKYDWLGASPDGLVGLDGAIEIKCPYPQYTKAPYSVFDTKKKMYLRQCQLVMEVLDVEWLDFICYLAPHKDAHPEYNIERLHREEGWLHQLLDGQLLPTPASGTVPRIDLYKEWHEHIMCQFNDKKIRDNHLGDKKTMFEVVENEALSVLSAAMTKKAKIESQVSSELAEIAILDAVIADSKKLVADEYGRNVTDGIASVQIIKRKPTYKYKDAFEALGGESSLLAQGLDTKDFWSAANTRQIKVKLGE